MNVSADYKAMLLGFLEPTKEQLKNCNFFDELGNLAGKDITSAKNNLDIAVNLMLSEKEDMKGSKEAKKVLNNMLTYLVMRARSHDLLKQSSTNVYKNLSRKHPELAEYLRKQNII